MTGDVFVEFTYLRRCGVLSISPFFKFKDSQKTCSYGQNQQLYLYSSHCAPGPFSIGVSICAENGNQVKLCIFLYDKKYPFSYNLHMGRLQVGHDTCETLQWRDNEHDGVSNHQPHDCFLNRLFICKLKKTSKLWVTILCVGNLPVTSEFPAQKASYAENVSILWRHHKL